MNDQHNTYSRYVEGARVRPRLVPEGEIEVMLARTTPADASVKPSSKTLGTVSRGGYLSLAVAGAVVAGATYGLVRLDDTRPTTKPKPADSAHYRVIIERDAATGDSTVIMIPSGDQKSIVDVTLPSDGIAVKSIRMFQLSDAELAPFGVHVDTAGAILYSRSESGTISKTVVSRFGTSFFTKVSASEAKAVPVKVVEPTIVTDDRGMTRMTISNDEDETDIELRAQMKNLSPTSPEYYRLSMEISRRTEARALARVNSMVPILIHSTHSYTVQDSIEHRWRPDVVIWYELTPEVLALLPERVRAAVKGMVSVRPEHASVASRSNGVGEPHREQLQTSETAPDVTSQSTPAVIDSIPSTRTQPAPADEPVTGRPEIDATGAMGAVAGFAISPNPATDNTALRVKLTAPRNLVFMLHDIMGRPIRELARVRSMVTGEDELEITLQFKELRGGVYLVSLSTDNGEVVTRRLVVKK